VPEAVSDPSSWRKPARVFVNSMSDLFHDGVQESFIASVFAEMALTPRHTFQVLTKRPERMLDIVTRLAPLHTAADGSGWPLPNVWIGVSCEDQQRADERIPLLLQTPAAVRFISAEPLLGPVDLVTGSDVTEVGHVNWLRGFSGSEPAIPGLDWVIVGGESGAGARPCNVAWVRSIVEQCASAGVACFVKQFGSAITGVRLDGPPYSSPPRRDGFLIHWTSENTGTFGLGDRKGGDPFEWPEDLRVREFPRSAVPA
jgi:protein gp37